MNASPLPVLERIITVIAAIIHDRAERIPISAPLPENICTVCIIPAALGDDADAAACKRVIPKTAPLRECDKVICVAQHVGVFRGNGVGIVPAFIDDSAKAEGKAKTLRIYLRQIRIVPAFVYQRTEAERAGSFKKGFTDILVVAAFIKQYPRSEKTRSKRKTSAVVYIVAAHIIKNAHTEISRRERALSAFVIIVAAHIKNDRGGHRKSGYFIRVRSAVNIVAAEIEDADVIPVVCIRTHATDRNLAERGSERHCMQRIF